MWLVRNFLRSINVIALGLLFYSSLVSTMNKKMEKEFINITNQFINVQKKMERVDSDFLSFGWKFIGNGVQKTSDDQIHTTVSTLR